MGRDPCEASITPRYILGRSVAELLAAADHVLLELGADGVVESRLLVVVESLAVDLRRPGCRVLATVAHPALVVLRGRQHRPVEAGSEPFHRVRRTQEVTAVPDLDVRVEGQ